MAADRGTTSSSDRSISAVAAAVAAPDGELDAEQPLEAAER